MFLVLMSRWGRRSELLRRRMGVWVWNEEAHFDRAWVLDTLGHAGRCVDVVDGQFASTQNMDRVGAPWCP